MDNQVKRQNANKNSPNGKKLSGVQKKEGIAKTSDRIERRQANVKGLSRKYEAKPSHFNYTGCKETPHTCLVVAPPELEKPPENDADGDEKADTKVAIESSVMKLKDEQQAYDKQSSSCKSYTSRVKLLTSLRRSTKSRSPSTRGKKTRLHFEAKERNVRANKFGRVAVRNLSPKVSRAPAVPEKTTNKIDSENIILASEASGNLRPLCLPFGTAYSNESSAVYPLESLESIESISDLFDNCESFSNNIPACDPPCLADNPNDYCPIEAKQKDFCVEKSYDKLVEDNKRTADKYCVESSQCSHEHCHADDRYIKTLENSKSNDDFKTCDENTDLNLESKEVVIEKMNFCWEEKEKDSLDIHSHGDEVLALADRRFAKESLESHLSTNQPNGEGISEGMNLTEGEDDDLDEREIPEKLCLQTYAKSKEGEAFQVCKGAQKRKSTELFKVHVHVHARSHQTAHTMSPKPNVKNTKEMVRSHGETVFQKNSATSRGNRKETVKSRDGTKLEANCDYGKETFSFLQTYKMSDIQKYAYRLSPSPSIALKQKQVNLATCGTFLKTSAPIAQRTASCRMSRSSLISEKNSDKSVKLNKATVLDLPKESPKTQTERNNMKHAQQAGREKNYNLYGSGVDRDRSSPEKRSRPYSKSVVPSRCQNEISGSTKLHSAPYKSHPMSTKTAPQKFSQKTSTKNQSSSVVKINYSRGGDQKMKSNAGASLHITPLYGKAQSGSDKCGPHFLENLAHLTAQSNESSNKSTEGIFSRAIFQPRKTQNMSSHPKQLKTAVCSSSLLLLKSKSLVAQNSHVDNFSIKRASSACSTSRAERERKASRDRDTRAAVTLKTAHIYSNESIGIEKKETSRVETTCADKSKTQLSKNKIPATKNITSTVRIKEASSEKRNVTRLDKVNDRKGKEATQSIKNVRKDFSKEFSNEESQHLTKHCRSTRNFVENLEVSQQGSQEELMPQSVVQETKEMKQCCIRVSTIQEAKDVAKSLMTSAYKDLMTANRWVSCNEDVSMVSTENVDFMEALRKFELASQVKQSKDAEDKMPPRLSANVHLSKDMTRKEMESSDDDERPPSRLKHCRRATASFGEINLLDTLVDSPHQNTEEKHTVNVRKIDFEPMICIPLANSESAIKVDHQDIGIDCQSLCLIKDLCKSPLGAENSAKGDNSKSLLDALVQKGNENEMCPIRDASDDQLELTTTNKQLSQTCTDKSQFKADVLSNHDDAINVVYEYPIHNIMNADVDESGCQPSKDAPIDKDFTESSNLITNCINNYDYVTEVEASGPNSFPSGSEQLSSFAKKKQSDEGTTKICSSGPETFVGQEKKETSPSASNSCSTNCSCHAVEERSPLIALGDHNQEAEDSESDDAKKSDSNEVISNAETTGLTDPQSLEETLTVTLVEKVNHYLANASPSVEWNNKTVSSESGASLLFERTQSQATPAKNGFDLTDFGTKWAEKITSDQRLKKTNPSYHSVDNTQSVVASSTDLNTNPDQGCASNRSSFIKSSEASFHSIVSSCGDEASLASIVVKVPVKDLPRESSSGSAANPNLNPSQHMADNLDYASTIPTSNRPTLDAPKLNLDTTSNHRTREIYPEESPERVSNSSASLPSSPNRAALVVTTASPTYRYSPRTNFPNSNIIVTSINKSPRDRNRLEVSELQELFESLSSRKSPIIAFKNETREIQTTPKVSKHTKGEYKGKDTYPPYRSPRKVEGDNLTTWTNNSLDLTRTATLIDHTLPVSQESGKKIKLNISDLSTDSFNSLFIENAMYLEDVSRLKRGESQLASRSTVPRKVKVKKLSFHKKSGKDEDGKKINSRNPSAQTSIGTGGGIEERENSWSASEEKTTSLAQEAAYFEGQFSPTTESNRITEFESPTLCLSEITDCNTTRSSFTEGLRSSSGNKSHETHLSKFSRQELKSRYEQARQNFQEIRAGDEANEGDCFSKTSPRPVVSHRVQVRQQDSDGRGGVTNEEVDPGLVWSKVDEMEARRRRRLLERATDVSSEDSPSWRSKVYHKETAEDSLTGRRDRAESRLAQSLSQKEETKERVSAGHRSRRGDDSGNNDLAERLARRRAQRLEEQAESSSLDGSADGNRLMGRRWSRDESVRSIDSSENGDTNTGVISSRRTRRSDDDYFSNITRNCSEENENVEGSIRSENSAENSGRRRSQRHRKSDNSEPHYWNSKDSANGFSVSSDTGDAFARRLSRDTDSPDESSVNVLDRKGRRQQPSKDSAFSEPREKSTEDVSFDLNNSNNNSSAQKVLLEETMLSAKALRDRRIEDFIHDCVETESTAKDKACVGNSNGSPYHRQQKPADHNFSHSQEQSKPTIAAPSEKQDSSFNGKDVDKPCEEDNQVLSNFKARLLRLRGVETDDTECLKENPEEVTMPPETRSIQESHKTEIYSENSIPEISQTNNATNNVDTTAESVLASCTPNASSATPEVERKSKRRVDKSAHRKSQLNMSTGSTDLTDETPHSDPTLEDSKTRRRTEGSVVSQHATFWENPNPQHAPPPSRARANIPTRYMGDLSAKISASRQKFSQQATEPDKSARSKLDTTNDVHLKTKKVDLGQLIQKFSGSESNSEKSETEAEATTSAVQRPWVRRQKAEEIHSSSEDSEGARRTPERTQSLRRYGEKPPDSSVSVSRLEKSASFRSEFMSRRLAQNTSELTNQFGKTKEVTPPPKEATPPLKDTHYLREASPLKTTSGVPLASERTLKLDNKTKDLSDSSSVGNVPNNASENAHSRNDPSSRAIFNSIRNFSPEPGSTLQKAPSSISSDTKLTDSTLASLGNRAWISGASRRSNAPSQTEKLDDKRKKDNAFETVGLPGKETSTSLTHPATSTTKNDLGKDKKPVLTTLDKSLELLSKVTEELDHPEQPSSLPPSPLDITSPRDKSRSPSIDDAQRYIREVETSIASISPRSSPEKTKDSNSLSSRFTYKFHDENKALEERKQQIDIHSVRDTKSSDRDMKLVDKGLNEKTVSDRSRDLSSRERDTKSQECDLKSQELSFKIRDRDIKSQERDIKSQERDIKSRERDPKLQERDIRTQKLETKTPDRDIKSQDLNIKSQDRDTKTPERDIKSQERDIKSQDCDTKRPEHNIKSQERDIKSQDRDTKRPEHNIKSQDRDIKSQDRDTKTPERNIKLHEGDPKKSNLTNMVKSTNVHQLQDAETGIDLVSQKIPLQPSPSSMASSIAETSLKAATVSAQFSVSSSSGMSRSSSFKDATDLTEKRKGILKRASSLKSSEGSSYPIVDPQLAKILQQRKHLVGDVLEEEEDKEDKEKKRTISATEEIQENLKYSMQKAAEQGRNPEEDEALKRMSVAERVQYMQHKMEEEKYAASASRSRSGMSTPRSRPVSGLITPTQFKYEGPHMSSSSSASSISALATVPGANSRKSSVTSVASASDARLVGFTSLSGPQLIEKLTEIAEASEAFQERRHRFQQRNRNDWRHQTQPVTLEEINAADSLETVSAFRALVRKKTSINAFDQLKDQSVSRQPLPLGGKKAEFPQHLTPSPKNQRRGRRLRHRTLPVTAEELNAVPENQMLIMHPEWAKTEDTEEKRDSKADSGILSGSDVDLLHEQSGVLASDLESGDKELSKMTISARANFFKGLEEKSRADREKEKSASGAKRYIMRKKRERSQTMPVTDDELMDAAESGDGSSDSTRMAQSEVVSRSRSTSISEAGEGGQHDEDELTKLSLSEKVKLFSQLKDKEQQPPPKVEAPVKRRGRKQPSRFSTQPVTSEEVEQAAAYSRISPLAMSLVKPPDPEMLKGLPLKDQRELMAQHAEMFLSQSSLRSISRSGSNTSLSQPSSRRASVTLEDAADKKPEVAEEERHDRRGIMKDKSASTKELHEIKSILRSEPVKVPSEPEVHSILKSPWDNHTSSSEPRGILKKAKSEDIPSIDSNEDLKSILKHDESDEEESHLKPRSRSNSQPYSILKREPSPQPGDHEIRSILKTPSHENVPHLTSAMRRGSSDSDSLATGSGALKSALRHRGQTSEGEEGHTEESASTPELKSALHKPHASSVEDILDDANSHIHVDLTLSISGTGHQGSSSRTSTSKPSGASSPPRSTDRSSLEKEDEVKTISSKAPVQDSLSEQATGEKDTLKVPEDTDARLGTSASEGEGESSAGELLDEPQKRLKKKSRINRATNSERYKTQPPELPDTSATTTEQTRRKYKYEGRNKTQPITTGEMREAEAAAPVSNLVKTPGGSISERLNQLKTSGNEEWKKRVEKKDDIIPLASPSVVKLREQSGPRPPRPTSIADRLNELEVSSKTWQNRVEESDAKQFTVAAKLSNNVTDSPLVNKLKNLPKKEGDGISPLASPVTPTKEFIAKIPLPKDIVHDPLAKIQPTKRESESEDKKEPVRVEVPNVSEELQTFFNVKTIDDITDRVELTVDDFDNIFIEAENILPAVHKIKPQRKARPTSLNPLKYMKVEILNEYLEVTSGVAEKELRRVKREGLAKDAGFAEAALAGLASKENFKQVELRRTDSGSSVHGVALEPYKDLMLFHVKGRRTVQTRVVEPHTRSVNSGDCYVLVTPDKVLQWEGQFANVIEKAKASEIASCIQTKKELCCKRANEVLTVYQSKDNYGNGKLFWSLLEGERQSQVCGPDNEDELYEASITKANMIYRLEGNALLPYTEYWGDLPKYEMLQKNEVIVFDFGTEFYLWQGKSVGMEQRKLGLKLAKQLFEKGYDYTESAINPLSPLRTEEHGGLPLKADKRPPWVIFGKVSQNMETILFREKFADWPDSSRMIGVKGLDLIGSENTSKDIQELKPYDATLMLPQNSSPVTLKLEGSDLGRGLKWAEDMQGFVKEQDIITISVATWHVLEYEHFKLDQASLGQFHEGDTYVVRWQYMIASANLRNVKGLAKNIPKGRERCAYFFWQGSQSTINEKGASALMTVELDEERGPQVRVLQGKEIPCFLNLFNGKMVVHIGKREDPSTSTQGAWRLFCVRGDYENETCLVEIPVSIEHLRSRSSLLLLNVNTGIVYIWHGCKSPKHTRELVRHTMDKFKESPPAEFGLHKSAVITITEVEEGEEKREIWAALDSRDRQLYHSLLLDPKPYTHTIRLFHMSSVNMVFEVHEQLNPSRVSDLTTPYPFLQSDLYKAAQPALFLVDNAHEVYLWQGWFPVGSHDTDNVNTGSATARFNMDRKCAMETTLHYCKVKNPTHPPTAYLVCAGVEPECFTTLFPVWTVDTVVQDIALEEGKSKGYKEKVSEVHHRLTKTKYTLAELQERPLPEGVEPMKLEFYLEDVEFEEILGMKRDEFYAQPAWKQRQLKIQAKLF